MTHALRDVPRSAETAAPPRQLQEGLAVVVCTYKRPASLKRFLDSLATQDRRPEQLIIVDASPTDDTEQMIRNYPRFDALASHAQYFHVSEPHVGLTRQRNFAVREVQTDLVAFFDDDVVLLPGCLNVMERVHRSGDEVAGVGARIRNSSPRATWLWRLRLFLRVISRLQPGIYERSGFCIPWRFLPETNEVVEGDFLPGCAMWKTRVAREIGFHEPFRGYALGEDLDFSLRARRRGRLLLAAAAQVDHLPDPAGRPDPYRLGYMEIYHRYRIHQRSLSHRTWRDIVWFVYAWAVDTVLVARHFLYPSRWRYVVKQLAGRFRGCYDLVRGR